jgi:hypothetical protein
VKRKELVLIFALGREITPYQVIKALLPKDSSVNMSEAGAFYTCKKELLEDGLVVELESKGKRRPIRTDTSKYFELILKGSLGEDFKKGNIKLFEKYAPKIVDFLAKKKLLSKEEEMSYPLVFFLFARYLTTVGNYFPDANQTGIVKSVCSFVESLSVIEKRELTITGNNQGVFRLILTLMPPNLFKEVFLEFGVKVFNAAIFRKEQFDFLIDSIAGIENEEDMQFLKDTLEELRVRKMVVDQEYDEQVKQNILKGEKDRAQSQS